MTSALDASASSDLVTCTNEPKPVRNGPAFPLPLTSRRGVISTGAGQLYRPAQWRNPRILGCLHSHSASSEASHLNRHRKCGGFLGFARNDTIYARFLSGISDDRHSDPERSRRGRIPVFFPKYRRRHRQNTGIRSLRSAGPQWTGFSFAPRHLGAVSFRPEQDSFIVLRSGETPEFWDACTATVHRAKQAISTGIANAGVPRLRSE
jgi:hypothetical protein